MPDSFPKVRYSFIVDHTEVKPQVPYSSDRIIHVPAKSNIFFKFISFTSYRQQFQNLGSSDLR